MSEQSFTGHGHAKVILTGEHAVVYGHPAIAMAIDRRVLVTLQPCDGPTGLYDGAAEDPKLTQAFRQSLPPEGWKVSITSDFPSASGMGSSAALAIALSRASAKVRAESLTTETLCERAMLIESVFHGSPSGIDHTVSARGGVLWYEKGPPLQVRPLPRPAGSLVILDSESRGDTRDMVQRVRAKLSTHTPILNRIGDLVRQFAQALNNPSELGALMTENHSCLQKIGVSTHELDELVKWSLANGALGAKLAGAGGGGVVLAITEQPEAFIEAAARDGVRSMACRITEST